MSQTFILRNVNTRFAFDWISPCVVFLDLIPSKTSLARLILISAGNSSQPTCRKLLERMRLRLRNGHLPVEDNGGNAKSKKPDTQENNDTDQESCVHTQWFSRNDL